MKFGVIGLGSIGTRHAANLLSMGHEVFAYDPDVPSHRLFTMIQHPDDIEADAMIIATPSIQHSGQLSAWIAKNRHVLIEKPIGFVQNDVVWIRETLEAADRQNLVVMTGNNMRFHPGVKRAKEWLGTRELKDPLWASFHVCQYNDKPAYKRDGVILNWLAHEVDLALHLLGPAHLDTASARILDGQDDIVDLVLIHNNGARTTVHGDYVTKRWRRKFMVGSEDDLISMQIDPPYGGTLVKNDGEFVVHNGGKDDSDGTYKAELQSFINQIEGKRCPIAANGWAGLQTLEILLQARKMVGL